MTRRLVSIETVLEINPIPGADNIEVATVKGWEVVTKRGEFKVGEKAAYFELDSWIPEAVAPFLCDPNHPRSYLGIEGSRLKTVRLRKQISQGLLIPLSDLIEKGYDLSDEDNLEKELGIFKYEPVTTNTANSKGNFPSFVIKTEELRIQNLDYDNLVKTSYYVMEKLDGSSLTVFWRDGEFGVCSRNMELKEDSGSKFWNVVNLYNLREKLNNLGRNIAIQGELIGHGIQKNRYNLNGNDFFAFTLFSIDKFEKLPYEDFINICRELGIKTVPILESDFCLPPDRKKLIEMADGNSALNPKTLREGFVLRNIDNTVSFKVISNKFLLKDN